MSRIGAESIIRGNTGDLYKLELGTVKFLRAIDGGQRQMEKNRKKKGVARIGRRNTIFKCCVRSGNHQGVKNIGKEEKRLRY